MKTKIVTIHNWDGSKYDVLAPKNAKWIGIFSHTGDIRFFKDKPKHAPGAAYAYASDEHVIGYATDIQAGFYCPAENRPHHDGYGICEGENGMSELLLKIEEV